MTSKTKIPNEQIIILFLGLVVSAITPFFWLTFNKHDVYDFISRMGPTIMLSIAGASAFACALYSVRNYLKGAVYGRLTRFIITGVCSLMTFISLYTLKTSVFETLSPEFFFVYIFTIITYWILSLIVIYGASIKKSPVA